MVMPLLLLKTCAKTQSSKGKALELHTCKRQELYVCIAVCRPGCFCCHNKL